MINYKKTYKESTSWRHWRLSCFLFVRLMSAVPGSVIFKPLIWQSSLVVVISFQVCVFLFSLYLFQFFLFFW